MSMKEWAKNEIALACKRERGNNPDTDWDYGCACYESALKAFNSILEDDHSGMSIVITKNILNRLIDGKPLTPINGTEDEWNTIADNSGLRGEISNYQCKRMSSLFKYVYSNGDIKYDDINRTTCVNINNPNVSYRWGIASDIIDEMFPITMPYIPESHPYKVFVEDFLYDIQNGDFDTVGVIYAIKPDGDKIEINRFYKEENHKMVEITEDEYNNRKDDVTRKDINNE